MTSKSDKYFLTWLESFGSAYKEAMDKKDVQALQGLTAFDISRRWAVGNTGSLIMSYLFKETLKTYKLGQNIPWLNYNTIRNELGKRKISENRMDMVIDALEEGGFIEVKEKTVRGLEGNKIFLSLKLTDTWKYFLTQYKRNKKQTMTFPHILGRQIYLSYLAKHKNELKLPTGINSFKILLIILNNATKTGYIDSIEGEKMFHKMGGVVLWHEVGEGDEIKREDIKFFTEDDGVKKKINPKVLKAYNEYLLPNYNRNSRRRGLV